MITITASDVSSAIRAAIKDRGPDYVDVNAAAGHVCEYLESDDQTPSCIVGYVLVFLGVNPAHLRDCDGDANEAIRRLEDQELIKIEARALNMLTVAQAVQDSKGTWFAAQSAATAVQWRMRQV